MHEYASLWLQLLNYLLQVSILYLRCGLGSARGAYQRDVRFNSLFEMLLRRLEEVAGVRIVGFNSLFEMRYEDGVAPLPGVGKQFQFSI